jgi:hypothetical protein
LDPTNPCLGALEQIWWRWARDGLELCLSERWLHHQLSSSWGGTPSWSRQAPLWAHFLILLLHSKKLHLRTSNTEIFATTEKKYNCKAVLANLQWGLAKSRMVH